MELRHLRYFQAVAEELSFTRAARRLHIGQPPLSLQIKALETELGLQLFERTKRRVILTPAGQRFLASARQILTDADRAIEEAQRAARGETGELRIGFTSSLPFTTFLPQVIRAYHDRFPTVTLTLVEMFSGPQIEAITAGRLEIGFLRHSGENAPAELDLRPIRRDPLRLAVHARHRLARARSVSFDELRQENFITYPLSAGRGLSLALRQLALAAGFEPKIVQEAREPTTQIGLVAAGLGIAVIPSPLECIRVPGVRYLALRDKSAHVTLAVARRCEPPSPLLAGFLATLDRQIDKSGSTL
jgi:DNA-binding transcriptional LysR family regulator